jgi:cytoskeletal protein CcmA (bactofilin family)
MSLAVIGGITEGFGSFPLDNARTFAARMTASRPFRCRGTVFEGVPFMANPQPAQNFNMMSMGSGLRTAPPTPPVGAKSPFGPASTMGVSVIGTDLTILGQNIAIISQNKLQIDGDVRGDVVGKEVTISSEGSVIGTVAAERIEVHGGVNGAIRAAVVIVHPTAQVDADILHRSLSVAEGAQLEGSLRKSKDERELVPNLDASSYASKTNGLMGANGTDET